MFVLLLFTMWLGKLVMFSKIWLPELLRGTYFTWRLWGWPRKVLVRCLAPCLSYCGSSVKICSQLLWFIQQPVWGLHTIGPEYLFVQWVNAYHLCQGFGKTWSPFGEAEHSVRDNIVPKVGRKKILMWQKLKFCPGSVLSQNWPLQKWTV